MTAGRSRGTPGGDEGWLPSPGRLVSGLVSANTTTSGEEFLDGKEEGWDSLRSIVDGHVRLDFASFYPFTTLPLWVVVCQDMPYGIPEVLLWPFLSGGRKVPRYYLLPDNLPI